MTLKSEHTSKNASGLIKLLIAWHSVESPSKHIFSISLTQPWLKIVAPFYYASLTFIYYSVEQSVKDDIAIITSSPYMRKELAERTKGFTYNIKTGLLSPVQTWATAGLRLWEIVKQSMMEHWNRDRLWPSPKLIQCLHFNFNMRSSIYLEIVLYGLTKSDSSEKTENGAQISLFAFLCHPSLPHHFP